MQGQMFRCCGCFRLMAAQDGFVVPTLEQVMAKPRETEEQAKPVYFNGTPTELTIDASALFGRALLCGLCLPAGVEHWPLVDVGIRP